MKSCILKMMATLMVPIGHIHVIIIWQFSSCQSIFEQDLVVSSHQLSIVWQNLHWLSVGRLHCHRQQTAFLLMHCCSECSCHGMTFVAMARCCIISAAACKPAALLTVPMKLEEFCSTDRSLWPTSHRAICRTAQQL